MRRSLLVVAAVVAGSGSASACLWDSELIRHEKEFRSGYQSKPRAEPPETVKRVLPWAMGGVGAVLLLAGGVSVARNLFRDDTASGVE